MNTRPVPEWISKPGNTVIPDRVKIRVLLKHDGHCAKCSRRLVIGRWNLDHIIALVNGGEHRESNLQPLCTSPCHSDKTALDVAEKSKVARVRAKHLGLKPSKQKIQSAGFRRAEPQGTASRPVEKRS